VGILSWVAYQTIINIGGITRSIPMTGIPLPFIAMALGSHSHWRRGHPAQRFPLRPR
jgi:hypothetical protein